MSRKLKIRYAGALLAFLFLGKKKKTLEQKMVKNVNLLAKKGLCDNDIVFIINIWCLWEFPKETE